MATIDVTALNALEKPRILPLNMISTNWEWWVKRHVHQPPNHSQTTPPANLNFLLSIICIPITSHIFAVYFRTPNEPTQYTHKTRKDDTSPCTRYNPRCALRQPSSSNQHPEQSQESSSSLKHPITPLSLPSPNTFPLFLAYIHTKQLLRIFS